MYLSERERKRHNFPLYIFFMHSRIHVRFICACAQPSSISPAACCTIYKLCCWCPSAIFRFVDVFELAIVSTYKLFLTIWQYLFVSIDTFPSVKFYLFPLATDRKAINNFLKGNNAGAGSKTRQIQM